MRHFSKIRGALKTVHGVFFHRIIIPLKLENDGLLFPFLHYSTFCAAFGYNGAAMADEGEEKVAARKVSTPR